MSQPWPFESPAAAAKALAVLLAATALLCAPAAAGVEDRVLVQGIAAGDMTDTDSDSYLLSRDRGDTVGDADLLTWQAFQFRPGLHLLAMEHLQASTEEGSRSTGEVDLLYLRYSRRSNAPVTVEAGRINMPVGLFSRKYFPDVNPLIGEPTTYAAGYPLGVQVTGKLSRLDYNAAVMSLPPQSTIVVPEPDDAFRPALGFGVTPMPGLRFGAYATKGPYLADSISAMLPAGSSWREFDQRILGFEVQCTIGYMVMEGELSYSAFEIPAVAGEVHGRAWYLENRYTWTPRIFSAVRLEENTYPFILPLSPSFWIGRPVRSYDAEAGIGYRLNPSTLVKVSYRREFWDVEDSIKQYYPEGYAVAAQLSHRFDVFSWFDRAR